MKSKIVTLVALAGFALCAAMSAAQTAPVVGGASAEISLDPKLGSGGPVPAGRLLLFFLKGGQSDRSQPGDAPFYEDPQPVFGVEVAAGALTPGKPVIFPSTTNGFPVPLGQLPGGKYKVQAVLVTNKDQGDWHEAAGNYFSESKAVTIGAGQPTIALSLTKMTEGRPLPKAAGVEFVKIPSPLLSKFAGHPVAIDVGVHWPAGVSRDTVAGRTFPTVYEVPGFSGNHRTARRPLILPGQLSFYIVVNPNNHNGHTLFADSPANGPYGAALTQDILPALEKQFPLTANADARLLRGHSSGGWTVLWLLLNYPETFGAAWSSSPDPVDFRAFERCDIYHGANMYTDADGKPIPASRKGKEMLTTVGQENAWEEVMSPGFTSGQQWGSWMSCWAGTGPGLRNLYEPATGVMDHTVAESMRKYDLADLLRKDPKRYLLLWQTRIFLTVGTLDDFYLNEAVALLEKDVKGLSEKMPPPTGAKGRITLVPDATHFTVFGSGAIRGIPAEMGDWLTRHNVAVLAPKATPTTAPSK